jgi:hypothetical protein
MCSSDGTKSRSLAGGMDEALCYNQQLQFCKSWQKQLQ